MASDDKWNDDETWDNVADAPLSPTQLAELVAACEQRPELWKRCAMVLLEEQALRHELQQMARYQLSSGPSQLAPLLSSTTPLPCPAPLAGGGQVRSVQRVGSPSGGAQPGMLFWNNLAMAAALLIVFGIGWQASQRFGVAARGQSNQAQVNGDPAIAIAQSGMSEPSTRSEPADSFLDQSGLGRPDYGLASNSNAADTATLNQEIIDQVNAKTLASAMQSDWNENLDPEYQQLRRAGYEVEAQKGLMPFWLYDGSSAVIPYQQIIVRPKSKSRNY